MFADLPATRTVLQLSGRSEAYDFELELVARTELGAEQCLVARVCRLGDACTVRPEDLMPAYAAEPLPAQGTADCLVHARLVVQSRRTARWYDIEVMIEDASAERWHIVFHDWYLFDAGEVMDGGVWLPPVRHSHGLEGPAERLPIGMDFASDARADGLGYLALCVDSPVADALDKARPGALTRAAAGAYSGMLVALPNMRDQRSFLVDPADVDPGQAPSWADVALRDYEPVDSGQASTGALVLADAGTVEQFFRTGVETHDDEAGQKVEAVYTSMLLIDSNTAKARDPITRVGVVIVGRVYAPRPAAVAGGVEPAGYLLLARRAARIQPRRLEPTLPERPTTLESGTAGRARNQAAVRELAGMLAVTFGARLDFAPEVLATMLVQSAQRWDVPIELLGAVIADAGQSAKDKPRDEIVAHVLRAVRSRSTRPFAAPRAEDANAPPWREIGMVSAGVAARWRVGLGEVWGALADLAYDLLFAGNPGAETLDEQVRRAHRAIFGEEG